MILDESDIHHIKNVMRIKANEEVLVCYEKVIYLCSLNIDYKTAKIKSIYKNSGEDIYILAYIPVLSEDKMSFVIEKEQRWVLVNLCLLILNIVSLYWLKKKKQRRLLLRKVRK